VNDEDEKWSDWRVLRFCVLMALLVTGIAAIWLVQVFGPDSVLRDCDVGEPRCARSHLEAIVPAFIPVVIAIFFWGAAGLFTRAMWRERKGRKGMPKSEDEASR